VGDCMELQPAMMGSARRSARERCESLLMAKGSLQVDGETAVC
jgi:hypothetical protein